MTPAIEELNTAELTSAARLRAQRRMYLALQGVGWGGLLVVQLAFGYLLTQGEARQRVFPGAIQMVVVGGALSHYARYYMERAGWKKLGWKPLVPRVLLMAGAQAVVICAVLWTFQRWVLGWPIPPKMSPTTVVLASILNHTGLMVGWLCIYFSYHLFDRFNRLEVDRLKLATMAKHAELRALKSQLNPHFIFNSLNSLRALIDENPARAREAVTQLANLLRYSLQSVQRETVPFEEELRVVRDYLSLEQVRHEERLRLRLDVPDEALHWPIPPLLLQTLVENAVKYGIASRPEGGEIGIVARCERGILTLRVTNPGRLAEGPAKNRSTGLGLSNAGERLRLIFGEKSSLEVRTEGADSVVAEAIIPLQPSRN